APRPPRTPRGKHTAEDGPDTPRRNPGRTPAARPHQPDPIGRPGDPPRSAPDPTETAARRRKGPGPGNPREPEPQAGRPRPPRPSRRPARRPARPQNHEPGVAGHERAGGRTPPGTRGPSPRSGMERPNPGRETGANGPENGADEEPRPRNNAEINEDRRERDGRATAGAEPERPST